MKVSLSSLYGPGQLFYYPADPREERELESVFLRTLDTLGELSTVVHSTANTPLQVQYSTVQSWNNGKSGAKLVLTSLTMPGLQIHKFDHTRTANPRDWLPCRCAALPLVGCMSATSLSC